MRSRPSSIEILEQRRFFAANIGANFSGTNRAASGFIPPDTMGAVGPSHFVEIINGRYRVYSKAGAQLQNRSLDQFWSDAGVSAGTSFSFDPRISFDPVAQRWYAASVDSSRSASSSFLFAVSRTTNPLDGFAGFRIDADPANLRWADFPQMGFDGTGVYLSANMFDAPGGINEFTDVSIVVIPKVDLLLSTPSVARSTLLENVAFTTGFSVQPVIAPNNSAQQGMMVSGDSSFVDFSYISGSIFSPSVSYLDSPSIPFRSSAPLARQPDGTRTLNTGDTRIRTSVQYELNSYWITQMIDSPSFDSVAVRMLRINHSASALVQEVIIEDSSLDFIYPSIAVNFRGDVVIGATGSGPSRFASSYALVGSTTGNTTTFDAPLLLHAGSGNYSAVDTSGRNRWGDYSETSIDPADPTRIWTIQEFAPSTNQWQMRITELRFTPLAPSVPDLTLASDTGISATDNLTANSTPTFTGTGSAGATVTLRANGVAVGSGVVDASGIYTITTSALANGSFNITAEQSVGTLTGPISSLLAVVIDTVAPAVTSARYEYQTVQQVVLSFNEFPLVSAAALVVTNTTTGQVIPDAQKIVSFVGSDVQLRFAALLADGVYELTLAAAAIKDAAGNGSAAITFSTAATPADSFFILAGDADRNRTVNFDDLLTTSQNYGQAGRNFSQGNFDYSADGLVGFDDLLLLAQRYGTSLFGSVPVVAGRGSRRVLVRDDILA